MIFVKMAKFKSLRETDRGQRRIARSVILAHKVPKTIHKFLVLVEGIDDLPIYYKFFNIDVVDIKDCNGCEHVNTVHETIKNETNFKFLSILDSDFKRLDGIEPFDTNVFYTDYHDSELMITEYNQVWKKVLNSVSPSTAYVDFRKQAKVELYNVSFIKWFNMHRKLSFVFEGLDILNLCPGKAISEAMALQYFKPSKNGLHTFPNNSFKAFKEEHTKPDIDQLTNGHDLITRIASIFRHRLKKQISDKDLRDCFCQNFTEEEAKRTALYRSLQSWCKINKIEILV